MPDPDDITQPDVDLGQAQIPDVAQAPTATPQLANQQPSGPRPILLDLIQGLVHPRMQSSGPGQMAQPVSRAQTFENFLGNFVYALGQGFQAAGHGPGSFGRGFGGAVAAPMELQAAQQQRASQLAAQQAQTAQTQQQTAAMQGTVQTPYGPMSPALAKAVFPAAIRKEGMESVAQTRKESAENVADTQAQARKDVAGANLQSKLDQFKQTLDYKKWKEQLDTDTKLKTASMMANATQNKAPAAMMQTASFAQSGINRLDDANQAFQDLKSRGVLGSVSADKIEDMLFGSGLIDPTMSPQDRKQIGRLRAALSYTSSAAMRAHTGRTSREIYHDFKDKLGLGQGSDALEGAMGETREMLTDYATSASDASIRAMRSGTPSGFPRATSKKKGTALDPLGIR